MNCTDYGLEISSSCSYNVIKWNNFLNNSGTCQIQDNGINNEFQYNFYNTWVTPDSDHNGIVDEPYIFDGSAENLDQYPLAVPCQPIPEWLTYTLNPTTSTSTNQPPQILELVIVGGVLFIVALVVVIFLKKRSG